MATISKNIFSKISDLEADFDESSWVYGATYDNLLQEDLDYGINNNGTWVPYNETGYTNKHMRLGISYDQYKNEINGTPEQTRVFFLDPGQFGGSYLKPPFYIKPEKQIGWLGLIDVLFPEFGACDPQVTDLIDLGLIQGLISEYYQNIPIDERLQSSEECIIEVPYNRLLNRDAKAGIYGLIKAAIRIFVSTHFIKALPTFTKFAPKFPDLYSSAFASLIVEDMQIAFLEEQGGVGDFFNTFSDNEFWYGFLEQVVQTYGYLVDSGKIVDVPDYVQKALNRLNDYQEAYDFANSIVTGKQY